MFFQFGASGIETWLVVGTSLKTSSCGAVTGVGFMLIDAVLCLQSQFEDCTLCIAEYSNILLLCAIWRKINLVILIQSGKAKLSMASCVCYKWPYITSDRNFWAFFDPLPPSDRNMTSMILNNMTSLLYWLQFTPLGCGRTWCMAPNYK